MSDKIQKFRRQIREDMVITIESKHVLVNVVEESGAHTGYALDRTEALKLKYALDDAIDNL